MTVPITRHMAALVRRDLRLAFRRLGESTQPLIFFCVVATLFPLSLSPGVSQLRDIGVTVLWVAALLSSLLALEGLFKSDAEDGSMEQLALTPMPLSVTVLTKVIVHWLVTGLPLVLVAPLVASTFYLPANAIWTGMGALLLATPVLSILGAVGAALTVGLKRSGNLLALLVLPLASPVLIFGTRAMDLAAQGEPTAGPLYLLAALLALALALGPLAAAAALRVHLE